MKTFLVMALVIFPVYSWAEVPSVAQMTDNMFSGGKVGSSALGLLGFSGSGVSTKDKSSDRLWGIIGIVSGVALTIIGSMPVEICDGDSCTGGVPTWGYVMIGGGILTALGGLYLIIRK